MDIVYCFRPYINFMWMAKLIGTSMELFDYLNNISTEKKELDFEDDEVNKNYLPYMINRWISTCDGYISLVNEINKYEVPKEIHHRFFMSTIPQRKQYWDYSKIKKLKDIDEKDIELICKYFECSKKEANQYLDILTKDQIKEIVDIYKYGKKNK